MVASVVNYRPHVRQARTSRPSSASPPLFHLLHQPLLPLSSPIFRIFFQVRYPATPLFATLTKTGGVCTNNSHSETHVSPVFNPIPYPPRPIPFCFTLLRTLLHFLALIKNSTPLFCYDSALFRQNTRGWGYPFSRYRPGTSLTDWTGSIPDTVSQWQVRVKSSTCHGKRAV